VLINFEFFLTKIWKCEVCKPIFARQLINHNLKTKQMKKVFFAFVAASTIVLAACNNKPAESTDATAADTTAVTTAVENTAPAETAPMDSTAPAATDSAAKM
jgi:hypothetical protein